MGKHSMDKLIRIGVSTVERRACLKMKPRNKLMDIVTHMYVRLCKLLHSAIAQIWKRYLINDEGCKGQFKSLPFPLIEMQVLVMMIVVQY